MRIHIVQKGDTLWNIAQKYGVDFETLKSVNTHISNPDMIMPGMKIKVPTEGVPVKKKESPQPYLPQTKKEQQIPKEEFPKEMKKSGPEKDLKLPKYPGLPDFDEMKGKKPVIDFGKEMPEAKIPKPKMPNLPNMNINLNEIDYNEVDVDVDVDVDSFQPNAQIPVMPYVPTQMPACPPGYQPCPPMPAYGNCGPYPNPYPTQYAAAPQIGAYPNYPYTPAAPLPGTYTGAAFDPMAPQVPNMDVEQWPDEDDLPDYPDYLGNMNQPYMPYPMPSVAGYQTAGLEAGYPYNQQPYSPAMPPANYVNPAYGMGGYPATPPAGGCGCGEPSYPAMYQGYNAGPAVNQWYNPAAAYGSVPSYDPSYFYGPAQVDLPYGPYDTPPYPPQGSPLRNKEKKEE